MPDEHTAKEQRGLELKCTSCCSPVYARFDVSLKAWDGLLDLVTALTNVSLRELQRSDGRRPSMKSHQARALLVQALFKVAGEDTATKWLRLVYGWSAKRVGTFATMALDNRDYLYLLERMGTTLKICAQTMKDDDNGI